MTGGGWFHLFLRWPHSNWFLFRRGEGGGLKLGAKPRILECNPGSTPGFNSFLYPVLKAHWSWFYVVTTRGFARNYPQKNKGRQQQPQGKTRIHTECGGPQETASNRTHSRFGRTTCVSSAIFVCPKSKRMPNHANFWQPNLSTICEQNVVNHWREISHQATRLSRDTLAERKERISSLSSLHNRERWELNPNLIFHLIAKR